MRDFPHFHLFVKESKESSPQVKLGLGEGRVLIDGINFAENSDDGLHYEENSGYKSERMYKYLIWKTLLRET